MKCAGVFSPLEGEMAAKQPEGVGQGSAGRKKNVEHCRSDPTRRLRRHPPLKGEGEVALYDHPAGCLVLRR